MWKKQLDVLDKIYYLRAFLGVICGIILGFIFNSMGLNSNSSVVPYSPSIIFIVALFFYIISYAVVCLKTKTLKTAVTKKIATNGISPFTPLPRIARLATPTRLCTAPHQSTANQP